jgi:hypothetical protein
MTGKVRAVATVRSQVPGRMIAGREPAMGIGTRAILVVLVAWGIYLARGECGATRISIGTTAG